MTIEIRDVAYHRNGVAGLPFYVVLFNDTDEGMFNQVATIDEDGEDCRVINAGLITNSGHIGQQIGMNTWRGDRYLSQIRDAMADDDQWDVWFRRIFKKEDI